MSTTSFSLSWQRMWVPLMALVLILGLRPELAEAQSMEFNGTWIANGSRQLFPFGAERNVYTFKVAGHVNLSTPIGDTKDFWSECVGLGDTVTGVTVRCSWRDLDGQEIYLMLEGEGLKKGILFTGTLVGGTHQFKNINGDLSFIWSSLVFQKEGGTATISGQSMDLKGRYHLP